MSGSNALALLLGLGAYVLLLLRTGSQAAVKASAEEAAKSALRQFTWPADLARELQKSRGLERQELRFKSYGALWKELRPLAVYDESLIDKSTVRNLSSKLSDWYFSECGGLLLTPQVREFYFALQDLLRATAQFPGEWQTSRPAASDMTEKDMFVAVLRARGAQGAIDALQFVGTSDLRTWQSEAQEHAAKWKAGINHLATVWKELDTRQRFVTLQQVASVLRTSLCNDVESRTL
jgi:hypothetical protein